jgi:hypothetical protein
MSRCSILGNDILTLTLFGITLGTLLPLFKLKLNTMTTRKRPQYPYAKKIKTINLEHSEKPSQRSQKSTFSKSTYMIVGALGAAALYGGAQIPFLRKVALPFLASVASKNWGLLTARLPMLARG